MEPDSHGPVVDQPWPLTLGHGLLYVSQGQLNPEAVADRTFDSDIFSQQFGVVLAGKKQGWARAEDAEAAGKARHPQAVRRMERYAIGLDPCPDLGDFPGVDR